MNIVNSTFLKNTFPPIKYAFISNYIIRTSRIKRLKNKEKPLVDTILVCDDVDNWHKQNFKLNKNHYPLIAKYTSVKLVTYFAKKGAKIHFNQFKTKDGELLRYGVVGWDDFKKDLDYWKSLTVSTYMHKPFEVVLDTKEVEQHQLNNLISAISIGALFNSDNRTDEFFNVTEKDFYDAIIQIPFVRGSYFKIFDDEIINFDINDLIDEFRNLYLPVIESMSSLSDWDNFIIFDKDCSMFKIKNSLKAKEFFLNHLNLQVYREVSKISHGILFKIIFNIVPDLVENKVAARIKSDEKTKSRLLLATDNIKCKILIKNALNIILKKHKSTKIFLIIMGKWFFFGFLLFKYIIKGIVLYIIYKRRYLY